MIWACNYLVSLALYIGMTFASFCDFGTIPFERDLFIRIDTGRTISCFISLVKKDNPSCPELFLRLSELINVLISYGSVGAKNMLCCDLCPINWSKENLEGGISLAYFLPIFVKKLQNSFDIVF